MRSYGTHVEMHTPENQRHLVLPDADVELVFYTGDGWFGLPGGPLMPLPPVFVRGPRSTSSSFELCGLARVVGMKLRPWRIGLLPELGTPVDGYYVNVGAELRELGERVRPLLERGATELALERVEAALLERQRVQRQSLDEVDVVGLELDRTHGAARIASLAAAQGLSMRQLERRFKSATGFAPKAFARLMRFTRASERLELDPGVSLTALSFELGYADQAHFTREFRAFAGMSPGKYVASFT
ncbi:helix-turn-helix domain-containing protein [Pendulispora albinea]|uniref:Helix-turn-helix domain-containing protein n=1 Tax=Pendulispora albinea TaxID=2741071 RepID=A0ABZ2LTK5_9BACT